MGASNFRGLPDVLNDTPWWRGHGQFDNRRGTERSLGFCDPYGYETDDMRVMGGMFDARNEKQWANCQNYAQGRYWMTCVNGHRDIMRLCYGHVWQMQFSQHRQTIGLCPRCAWPPRAKELKERLDWLAEQMFNPGAWPDDVRRWALAHEDARREMDELRQRGVITSGAPLRLEEVS